MALVLENGTVTASEEMIFGDLKIVGTYDVADGSCTFAKRYASARAVQYCGDHVEQEPRYGFSGTWCRGASRERFWMERRAGCITA